MLQVAELWKSKERDRLLRQVLTGSVKRAADIKKIVTYLRELVVAPEGSAVAGGFASRFRNAAAAELGSSDTGGFSSLVKQAVASEQQRKWRDALAMWEPMLREVEAGTAQFDPQSDWCKATYNGKAYYWKDVDSVLSFTRELPPGEGVKAVAEESREEFQSVYHRLQKEQEGVEAVGAKYNALSPWQMAIKVLPVGVDEPEEKRVYYWRSKPTRTYSLKLPKPGVRAAVKKSEDDFNRCYRSWIAVLDMAQRVTPDTLWPGEPAASCLLLSIYGILISTAIYGMRLKLPIGNFLAGNSEFLLGSPTTSGWAHFSLLIIIKRTVRIDSYAFFISIQRNRYPPEWESRLLEIHKRMPAEIGSAAVVFALNSCDGHGALATKLLQQFCLHHMGLTEEGQQCRFKGKTSVAIELLHAITDIQVLFQKGDYFRVRKACEDTGYRQKHEEVQVQFTKQLRQLHTTPDDEVSDSRCVYFTAPTLEVPSESRRWFLSVCLSVSLCVCVAVWRILLCFEN